MSEKFENYLVDIKDGEVVSAHLHRGTSYVADLYKNNWAYEKKYDNKNMMPKLKDSATVHNIYQELSNLNDQDQEEDQHQEEDQY